MSCGGASVGRCVARRLSGGAGVEAVEDDAKHHRAATVIGVVLGGPGDGGSESDGAVWVEIGADGADGLAAGDECSAGGVEAVAGCAEGCRAAERRDDGLGEAPIGHVVPDEGGEPSLEGSFVATVTKVRGERGDGVEVSGDQRQDEVLAGREVPIQRAGTDPGAASDVVHRGPDAMLEERFVGDGQQTFAVAPRVGASGLHRLRFRRLSPYSRRHPPDPSEGALMDTSSQSKDAAIFEQQPPLRSLTATERETMLAGGDQGMLATVRRDGTPHLAPVLYRWDPDSATIRISTRADRVKARNVAANGVAALAVGGPDRWSFVVAEGHAEVSPVSTRSGDATGRELLELFPQPDAAAEQAFLALQVTERRVVIRLHPTRFYGDIIELSDTA
jgi:PPOX class probable F420-dependent enzyme